MRNWSVRLPLYFPDPLLPPDPPDPAPEPAPSRRGHITCEFCRCRLTPSGDYLALSDEAKAFRAQGERVDRLVAELQTSREHAETLERELAQAQADLRKALETPTKKPGLLSRPV